MVVAQQEAVDVPAQSIGRQPFGEIATQAVHHAAQQPVATGFTGFQKSFQGSLGSLHAA